MVGDLGHEDLGLDARHGRGAAADRLGALVEVRAARCAWSFLRNSSSAASMPSISSLFTFMPRPTVLPLGGALRRAASMRSLRPSSRPALCGPRMPLPPENVTRSNPIFVYFQRFSTGGTSAAASLKVGTPCFLPSWTNSSSRILPFRVVVVVEEHHGGLRVDRALEVLARSRPRRGGRRSCARHGRSRSGGTSG